MLAGENIPTIELNDGSSLQRAFVLRVGRPLQRGAHGQLSAASPLLPRAALRQARSTR